jgi:hypothetical protein
MSGLQPFTGSKVKSKSVSKVIERRRIRENNMTIIGRLRIKPFFVSIF